MQTAVLNGALLALTLYCAHLVSLVVWIDGLLPICQVSSGEEGLTVGDFVLLGTYFMQVPEFTL